LAGCDYAAAALMLMRDGVVRVYVAAARSSLEACLQLNDACLHRHNKHLAEVHDALARCLVMLGTSYAVEPSEKWVPRSGSAA